MSGARMRPQGAPGRNGGAAQAMEAGVAQWGIQNVGMGNDRTDKVHQSSKPRWPERRAVLAVVDGLQLKGS